MDLTPQPHPHALLYLQLSENMALAKKKKKISLRNPHLTVSQMSQNHKETKSHLGQRGILLSPPQFQAYYHGPENRPTFFTEGSAHASEVSGNVRYCVFSSIK